MSINPHYMLKVVMSLNRLKRTKSEFFLTLVTKLDKESNKLKVEQLVELCHSIAKCEENELQGVLSRVLTAEAQRLSNSLSQLSNYYISQLLFCCAWLQDIQLFNIFAQGLDINQVPKSLFCDTFWSFLVLKQYEKATAFLPIVKTLGSFGDIKYFFDHNNFITLVWCCFVSNMYSQNKRLQEEFQLEIEKWQQFQESVLDINPNTLGPQVLKRWVEVLSFINIFLPIQHTLIQQALQTIHPLSFQHILQQQQCRTQHHHQILNILQQQIEQDVDEECIVTRGWNDIYGNYLELAMQRGEQKVGLVVVDDSCYIPNTQQYTLQLDFMLRTLKFIYNWKLVILNQSQINSLTPLNIPSFVANKFIKRGRKNKQ